MDECTIDLIAGVGGMPDGKRLNDLRMAIERRIIRRLLRDLYTAGWHVSYIDDGGDEPVYVKTRQEAHSAVFAVDESRVYFKHGTGEDAPEHGVFIIAGEGWSLITDWSYSKGDPDGFDAIVTAVTDYAETLDY